MAVKKTSNKAKMSDSTDEQEPARMQFETGGKYQYRCSTYNCRGEFRSGRRFDTALTGPENGFRFGRMPMCTVCGKDTMVVVNSDWETIPTSLK